MAFGPSCRRRSQSSALAVVACTARHTLVLDAATLSQLSDGHLTMASPQGEIEKVLPPCQACSGAFRYLNPLRCPHCRAPYIDFPRYPDIRRSEYYGNVMFGSRPQHLAAKRNGLTAKRIIAQPGWGTLVVEDADTHELSLQCLGGSFAMYWHRVVLTPDEVAAFRAGQLDVDAMVREMNRGTERMAKRILPGYELEQRSAAPKLKRE